MLFLFTVIDERFCRSTVVQDREESEMNIEDPGEEKSNALA